MSTRMIQMSRVVDAPPAAAWAVLADFPNISRWNGGVTASHATGFLATLDDVFA